MTTGQYVWGTMAIILGYNMLTHKYIFSNGTTATLPVVRHKGGMVRSE